MSAPVQHCSPFPIQRAFVVQFFAEQLEVQSDDMAESMRVNADVGVHWVLSFLSADKKKTYYLYEAISGGCTDNCVIG